MKWKLTLAALLAVVSVSVQAEWMLTTVVIDQTPGSQDFQVLAQENFVAESDCNRRGMANMQLFYAVGAPQGSVGYRCDHLPEA